MDAQSSAAVSTTADREIATVRIFDAPRELVWKAWADLEHIEQWWCPIGFTTTTKVFEFHPGGQWLHTMHGPDRIDYRNEITFTEIAKPERIEYDHGPSPVFHVTVMFDEEGNSRTKLSMQMLFQTREERDRTVEKFGAIEGQRQTLARLEEYLAKM